MLFLCLFSFLNFFFFFIDFFLLFFLFFSYFRSYIFYFLNFQFSVWNMLFHFFLYSISVIEDVIFILELIFVFKLLIVVLFSFFFLCLISVLVLVLFIYLLSILSLAGPLTKDGVGRGLGTWPLHVFWNRTLPGMFSWKFIFVWSSTASKTFLARYSQNLVKGPV